MEILKTNIEEEMEILKTEIEENKAANWLIKFRYEDENESRNGKGKTNAFEPSGHAHSEWGHRNENESTDDEAFEPSGHAHSEWGLRDENESKDDEAFEPSGHAHSEWGLRDENESKDDCDENESKDDVKGQPARLPQSSETMFHQDVEELEQEKRSQKKHEAMVVRMLRQKNGKRIEARRRGRRRTIRVEPMPRARVPALALPMPPTTT